jgi:putative heme-binding domain-containing protein
MSRRKGSFPAVMGFSLLAATAFVAPTVLGQSGLPAAGNEAAGAAVVAGKGMCLGCHRVHSQGSRLGPDLTDIGTLRRPDQLETSLLEPDAEILPENRFYQVVTRDGVTVAGKLLNLDTFQVLMLDTKEQLRSFDKSELREHSFVKGSKMPSYREKLSRQELADVIAYLSTLKGVAAQ